jgi:hypothetical protein
MMLMTHEQAKSEAGDMVKARLEDLKGYFKDFEACRGRLEAFLLGLYASAAKSSLEKYQESCEMRMEALSLAVTAGAGLEADKVADRFMGYVRAHSR